MTNQQQNSARSSILQVFQAALFCFLILYSQALQGQNFTNSDLDGSAFFYSSLPDGWEKVPVGDPVCLASSLNVGDTPDLANASNPGPDNGVVGIAFSGNTFVCGLRMNGASVIFHEGIQQTVNGLVVGQTYEIEFYQTVVKQSFAIDNSGSWSVYMDDLLLGVSEPSNSDLIFNDINLSWDARSVSFTPTSSSHTFKFMPTDDDNNLATSFTDPGAGLRMGIDLITINTDCALDLGPDLTLCEIETPFEIGTALAGNYTWSTGEVTSSIEVVESGTYIIEVDADCGTVSDTIQIEVVPGPEQVDLGEDLTLCPQDFPIELTANAEGNYAWSTAEFTQSITVSEPGDYFVSVSNTCGAVFDSVVITEAEATPTVNLGADLEVCADDFPINLNAGLFTEYEWSTGAETQSIQAQVPGVYTVTVSNACGSGSDEISIALLDPPAPITLGEDISICENLLPIALAIESDLNIEWSTGSNEALISVDAPGSYSVEVSNQCGVSSASILITALPNPEQAESFTLCQGESVSFLGETFSEEGLFEFVVPDTETGGCDILWNVNVEVIPTDTIYESLEIGEGETEFFNGNTYDEAGLYFLTDSLQGACDRITRLIVDVKDEAFVYVPSAFTPNDDGINDTFKPEITLVGDLALNFFEFEIYDRFGQIIYASKDPQTTGWNGSGSIDTDYFVQDGVYTWVLRYGTSNGADREVEYGSVAIVR